MYITDHRPHGLYVPVEPNVFNIDIGRVLFTRRGASKVALVNGDRSFYVVDREV
jgi:hypothetical protein